MRQILLFIFSSLSISLCAQVLRSNGSGLIIVDSTQQERQLSNTEFIKCACTEYVDLYDIADSPGKIYYPKLNDQHQMILKDQEDHWVLVSLSGELLHTFDPQGWDPPCYYQKGRYSIIKEDTAYIFTLNHKLVKKVNVTPYMAYGDAYLSANEEGKYAILDIDGNVRIPYDHKCSSWDMKNFSFSSEGLVALKNSKGKCGIVNFKGDTILPFVYDYIDDPHSEQNYIQKDGLWGTVDPYGKSVTPMIYEELPYPAFYHNKINIVKKDGKWIITDADLIPVSDKKMDDVREIKIRTKNGWHMGKYRIYTESGKSGLLYAQEKFDFFTDAIYDSIICLDTFYFAFKPNEIVIYEENGKIHRTENGGSISTSDDFGNPIETVYKQKQLMVIANGKKGIQQITGETIVECQYDNIEYKSNHFLIWKENKVGLVDWDGTEIIAPIYDRMEIEQYMDSSYQYQLLIKVEDAKKVGVLNEKSEVIIPLEYEQIQWINLSKTPAYIVVKNKLHGLVGSKNQVIVPISYEGSCPIIDKYIAKENYFGISLIFYNSGTATHYLLNGKIVESKKRKKSDEPCLLFD